MKLYVDTSDVVFEVGKPFEAKRDPEGRQRKERSGEQRLLWVVQLVAFAADGVETLNVTVASDAEPPRLTQKQSVTPVGLEAVPWAKENKAQIAFRAESIQPLAAAKPSAASSSSTSSST